MPRASWCVHSFNRCVHPHIVALILFFFSVTINWTEIFTGKAVFARNKIFSKLGFVSCGTRCFKWWSPIHCHFWSILKVAVVNVDYRCRSWQSRSEPFLTFLPKGLLWSLYFSGLNVKKTGKNWFLIALTFWTASTTFRKLSASFWFCWSLSPFQ